MTSDRVVVHKSSALGPTSVDVPVRVRERPIIFSGPMVRAILAGTKTQTRRIVVERHFRPAAGCAWSDWKDVGAVRYLREAFRPFLTKFAGVSIGELACPYGAAGERLWVRETWRGVDRDGGTFVCRYAADDAVNVFDVSKSAIGWEQIMVKAARRATWMPAIFLPRSLSRIVLEVEAVRVERLQEISEGAAEAEGVEPFFKRFPNMGRDQRLTTGELAADAEHRASFAVTWDEIQLARDYRANHDPSWKANPWVWVITFRRAA